MKDLRQWTEDALAEATGSRRRRDPVLPGTGGPAGNALLTAWTGLILLLLFGAEVGTLLDLRRWLSWHIAIGIVLIPPALLKTASTSWRIAGYYTRRTPYRQAGPPPMPLRLLGPLVVLLTWALLGSGLALVVLGPDQSRRELLTLFGFKVNTLDVHKAAFLVWAAVTGIHTAGRLLPALGIVAAPLRDGSAVPGRLLRIILIAATLLVSAIAATLILRHMGPWLTSGMLDR